MPKRGTFDYRNTERRPQDVYLFPNGNIAVCCQMGQQMGHLQGQFSIELLKRIFLEASPTCSFQGLEILPGSWVQECKGWADYWRERGITDWDEIQNI